MRKFQPISWSWLPKTTKYYPKIEGEKQTEKVSCKWTRSVIHTQHRESPQWPLIWQEEQATPTVHLCQQQLREELDSMVVWTHPHAQVSNQILHLHPVPVIINTNVRNGFTTSKIKKIVLDKLPRENNSEPKFAAGTNKSWGNIPSSRDHHLHEHTLHNHFWESSSVSSRPNQWEK